jgi:hypothetical protein
VILLPQLYERLIRDAEMLPDEPGCWLWAKGVSFYGYGALCYEGKSQRTHRLMWLAVHGAPEANVLHKCDVPACINPAHLYVGTQVENLKDAYRRGRKKFSPVPLVSRPRGMTHYCAKLTPEIVREIRRLSALGKGRKHGMGARVLGRKFGVDSSTISRIQRRETWKHVE